MGNFLWSLERQLVISQTQPVHLQLATGSPHWMRTNVESKRILGMEGKPGACPAIIHDSGAEGCSLLS
jgi:hypothetical protein